MATRKVHVRAHRRKGTGGVREHKRKEVRVITTVNYQTGKRKSLIRDQSRDAMPPGMRRSKRGKKYWETRRNRSDLPGVD